MKDNMKLEMKAGRNIQLDHIKEIMKQNIPDLLAENQRLKEQLDREIHINRKMKNAISLASYYLASPNELSDDVPNEELAFQELRKVLKEIDNKD